jgi:hypothetical protein
MPALRSRQTKPARPSASALPSVAIAIARQEIVNAAAADHVTCFRVFSIFALPVAPFSRHSPDSRAGRRNLLVFGLPRQQNLSARVPGAAEAVGCAASQRWNPLLSLDQNAPLPSSSLASSDPALLMLARAALVAERSATGFPRTALRSKGSPGRRRTRAIRRGWRFTALTPAPPCAS